MAVRRALNGLAPGDLVLAACSGGADSLALAAALAFEAPRAGLRAGAVTVDHGLQAGSAEQAASVADTMRNLGLDPVLSVRVTVARPDGDEPYPGPEAAARAARYTALDEAADSVGAAAIFLGHTLDDQAETVLLGLCRGAGARSLAGMGRERGRYRRPLLDVRRVRTGAACAAQGLSPWDDPHNDDPAFARVRVRRHLMPVMEAELGPGVAEALARTARLLRADADALDALAAAEAARLRDGDGGLGATALAALPDAVRLRVLRGVALAAGCPAGALSERNIADIDRLVTAWRGQRWADLPGGVRCERRYGRLLFTTPPRPEAEGGRERHGSRSQGSPDHSGADQPASP